MIIIMVISLPIINVQWQSIPDMRHKISIVLGKSCKPYIKLELFYSLSLAFPTPTFNLLAITMIQIIRIYRVLGASSTFRRFRKFSKSKNFLSALQMFLSLSQKNMTSWQTLHRQEHGWKGLWKPERSASLCLPWHFSWKATTQEWFISFTRHLHSWTTAKDTTNTAIVWYLK